MIYPDYITLSVRFQQIWEPAAAGSRIFFRRLADGRFCIETPCYSLLPNARFPAVFKFFYCLFYTSKCNNKPLVYFRTQLYKKLVSTACHCDNHSPFVLDSVPEGSV